MTIILHITNEDEWKQAQAEGIYRGDTLDSQGFIHCSSAKQIVNVANTVYRGQRGHVLLCIDSKKLSSKLRFDTLSNGESYPHIYGPLNTDAIIKVLSFEPNADGTFSLPKEVNNLSR